MTIGVISHFHLIRTALCGLLSATANCQVVLDTDDIQSNIDEIGGHRPRILLIEVLNCAQELAGVRLLKKFFPEMRILLLLETEDAAFSLRAIEAGVQGCLSKNCSPQMLAKALQIVDQGQLWISREAASLAAGKLVGVRGAVENGSGKLTERELEVLALLALGHGNKAIANQVSISENTIKAHLASIFRKLHVTNRLEAALRYFEKAQQSPRFAKHENINAALVPAVVSDTAVHHLDAGSASNKKAA